MAVVFRAAQRQRRLMLLHVWRASIRLDGPLVPAHAKAWRAPRRRCSSVDDELPESALLGTGQHSSYYRNEHLINKVVFVCSRVHVYMR